MVGPSVGRSLSLAAARVSTFPIFRLMNLIKSTESSRTICFLFFFWAGPPHPTKWAERGRFCFKKYQIREKIEVNSCSSRLPSFPVNWSARWERKPVNWPAVGLQSCECACVDMCVAHQTLTNEIDQSPTTGNSRNEPEKFSSSWPTGCYR